MSGVRLVPDGTVWVDEKWCGLGEGGRRMTEEAVTLTRRLVRERRERLLDEAVRRVCGHWGVTIKDILYLINWSVVSGGRFDDAAPVKAIRAEYRRLVAGWSG